MKSLFTTLLSVILFVTVVTAQSDEEKKTAAAKEAAAKAELGWKKGGSIGFNVSGLGLFNPRSGAGGNNFGFGGVTTLFANKKAEKSFWTNKLDIQLAAQKVQVFTTTTVGNSTVTNARRDFLKNLDVMRFSSAYGLQLNSDKLFAALDLLAQTVILKTYQGNSLNQINNKDQEISKFLSPLSVNLAPGLAYNPDPHWSLFYSPIAVQYILVADEAIARQFIHLSEEASQNGDGRSFLGLGSRLRVGYNNKYYKEKVAITSNINLFSNYLSGPQNVDVLWTNTLDFQLFKGFSLGLFGDLFYDNDINVQIDRDGDGFFGETSTFTNDAVLPANFRDELAPAASFTGGFLLKYSRIF